MNKFALVGSDIAQSLSPELWRFFAEKTGVNLTYELCDTDAAVSDGALMEIIARYDAVNITSPFKNRAAALFGAGLPVNLIVNSPPPKAYSLDGVAVVKALELFGIEPCGKELVVAGAGGAAEAAVAALAQAGARVVCLNRTEQKARALGEKYGLAAKIDRPYGVLNFTSEGADLSYLNRVRLDTAEFIFDANYKIPSELLRFAAKTGKTAINGLSMLFFQGAEGFRLCTGKTVENQAALLKEFIKTVNRIRG